MVPLMNGMEPVIMRFTRLFEVYKSSTTLIYYARYNSMNIKFAIDK